MQIRNIRYNFQEKKFLIQKCFCKETLKSLGVKNNENYLHTTGKHKTKTKRVFSLGKNGYIYLTKFHL